MSPFGTRLAAIDEVVRQTARDHTMSEPDFRLLAERLDTALRQVLAIEDCRAADVPRSTMCRRPLVSARTAA